MRSSLLLLVLSSLTYTSVSLAATSSKKTGKLSEIKSYLNLHVHHPLYMGGSFGYGNTDWSEITTERYTFQNNNLTAMTAPISADSSSATIGAFVGYQFTKHFAVEADYVYFPNTKVGFQSDEEIRNSYHITSLTTDTHDFSVIGKILIPILSSTYYLYADAGLAYVLRVDRNIKLDPNNPPTPTDPAFKKQTKGHFGPTFGFGLAKNFATHFYTELAFNYTTGYGKADLKPAEDYIPFVYSLTVNLGYRI